jgi:hypothetical protein
VPGLLRRLRNEARRRVRRREPGPAPEAQTQADGAEAKRRLDEAHRRLKQAIPRPEDEAPPD